MIFCHTEQFAVPEKVYSAVAHMRPVNIMLSDACHTQRGAHPAQFRTVFNNFGNFGMAGQNQVKKVRFDIFRIVMIIFQRVNGYPGCQFSAFLTAHAVGYRKKTGLVIYFFYQEMIFVVFPFAPGMGDGKSFHKNSELSDICELETENEKLQSDLNFRFNCMPFNHLFGILATALKENLFMYEQIFGVSAGCPRAFVFFLFLLFPNVKNDAYYIFNK
jgi:hypothetical protein